MTADGVVPGVDFRWLERSARSEPVEHAYALWDIVQAPDRTRFVSLVRDGETRGYVLLWHGNAPAVIAHWVGETDPVLLPWLPHPPCVLLVPPAAAPLVEATRPGLVGSPTLMMVRDTERPFPRDRHSVRKLTGRDRSLLVDLVDPESPMHAEYAQRDPEAQPVWGAFDKDRLIGVARASVTLPFAWVIAGVYTRPDYRGRGVAQAVTAALCRHAEGTGAVPGLFVREENAPARRAYENLGFRTIGRKIWFETAAPRVA
ncbi:MAG: GNAT family N-acetyltransferase [Thermoplasmata archaeon]|nr:GNAT family N-acetyltransferase [Thermoplasmata archaeon]MCI4356398.1 GNAT family N-acetyltransferase [Thermoplasmata archaeon]